MGRPEAKIEHYVVGQVALRGGTTRKVVYQGSKGSPDRWCFFKGGRLCMIECKADKGRVSAVQEQAIQMLRDYGFKVYVCRSQDEVDAALDDFLIGDLV